MARNGLFFVVLLTLITVIRTGESASVAHEIGERDSLDNWKDKLTKVLDTESKELVILHNLIEDGESRRDHGISAHKVVAKSSPVQDATPDSVAYLREQGIISKLEENSERMNNMIVFLSDLKSVLSQAISAQDKQMRFETEVVELREEIDFLRKEVQHIKHAQALETMNKDQAFLEHKINNDETTIQWLKDSSKELQKQMNEMSKTCNASSLLTLQQALDQQSQKEEKDLLIVQQQIQDIHLQQLKQEEKVAEANENIGDLRLWQTNMGQKLVDGQLISSGDDKVANIVDAEEHFLTEALKDAANFTPKQGRHSKRLKAQLREIHKTTKLLAKDHYHMNKRLEHLEKNQEMGPGMSTNRQLLSATAGQEIENKMDKRLLGLEDTMRQYILSLQNVGDKVNVVRGLQESTSQLFSAMEDLEMRYDDKFTDMHTTLAKVETSVNGIANSNEDLKEQQSYQVGIVQNVKKELMQTKDHLQKNNFRLASLQTQLLKWSSQKCSMEDSEAIQNIRISSLESLLPIKPQVPQD